MSFAQKFLGDPTVKILKSYEKSLSKVYKASETYTASIQSLEDVTAECDRFRELFVSNREKRDQQVADIQANDDLDIGEMSLQTIEADTQYHKERKRIMDSISYEAYALHRRACELIIWQTFELPTGDKYTWNMIPYDVQILGAMTLNDGNIAEMKTGEWKTLVATIAAFLNAISGEPVHVVTVNEYLAARDAAEMGVIYGVLGLTTGVIKTGQSLQDKKQQYLCDIVYGTNNEYGFDYLRDNMASSMSERVMRDRAYAIVDEVDSVLVDEARTPLIISQPDNEPTSKYLKFKTIAGKLEKGMHYKVDEKSKAATLTEKGIEQLEKILWVNNIFNSDHHNDVHHIENALQATACYEADKDYIIRDGNVMIIDEHTGRVMDGRRFSNGLHQALEAKEWLEIQKESKTLASITFQNYFRLYTKLSGMTGTAKTEEEEFQKIYGLDVIVVPTNKPIIREDHADLLFKSETGKFEFLANKIKEIHETGQPILVGTVSVMKSEYLSQMLTKMQVAHEVLNAKQDAREAEIVAKAGDKGSVTIATNMAGRGTDIKLSDEVLWLGWLYVIGTEKHETRRIDNQLRGRSGRQWDPGATVFLVSPQDDIMRIFGGDKLFSVFNSPMFSSLPSNEPILQSGMLTKRITSVQKQVEGRNFDTRKHILEYDDVLDQHRRIMYTRRARILENLDDEESSNARIDKIVQDVAEQEAKRITDSHTDENGSLDEQKVFDTVKEYMGDKECSLKLSGKNYQDEIYSYFESEIASLAEQFQDRNFDAFQRQMYLSSIDQLWMGHIDRMSHLREEVAFEGYAQRQPLQVYKERSYEIFMEMLDSINYRFLKNILSATAQTQVKKVQMDLESLNDLIKTQKLPMDHPLLKQINDDLQKKHGRKLQKDDQTGGVRVVQVKENEPVRPYVGTGRNEDCPCGSGKRFKHCHGRGQ